MWNPFNKKPLIVSCEIVVIADQSGVKNRHGFVEIVPDMAARRVVSRLHGKSFNSKRVIVRQYLGRKIKSDVAPEDDLRRPNLKVTKHRNVEIEGMDAYTRISTGK